MAWDFCAIAGMAVTCKVAAVSELGAHTRHTCLPALHCGALYGRAANAAVLAITAVTAVTSPEFIQEVSGTIAIATAFITVFIICAFSSNFTPAYHVW